MFAKSIEKRFKGFWPFNFCQKKVPKKLKTVSLLTKRNELSAKSIVKLFKALKLILFCLKKVEKKLNWKEFCCSLNEINCLLNWLQTLLNFYFLNRFQNFLKYFNCQFFWSKKAQKTLKMVKLFTKRTKISAQWIAKLFKGFYLLLFSFKKY